MAERRGYFVNGNQIPEKDVRLMQAYVIGISLTSMGPCAYRRLSEMRKMGVDLPVGSEWFAPRTERAVLYHSADGLKTYGQLAQLIGTASEGLKNLGSRARREGREMLVRKLKSGRPPRSS